MRSKAICALVAVALLTPAAGRSSTDVTPGGVTDDAITVVLYNGLNVQGDLNQPWQPSDEPRSSATDYQTVNLRRTIKALRRSFQQRYETHGRTVSLWGAYASLHSECDVGISEAQRILNEFAPFAVATLAAFPHPCFYDELAANGVMVFGLNRDEFASTYSRNAPYAWGFAPDLAVETASTSSFLCRSLAGRPARFTDDPLLVGKTRTFGIILPRNSPRSRAFSEAGYKVMQRARARCGLSFETAVYDAGRPGAGLAEAPGIMARFKASGITTVLCYCIPVFYEMTVTSMQRAATAVAYHPEWFWDDTTRMDRSVWQKAFGDPAQRSFGTSWFAMQPPVEATPWYRAYAEQEPESTPNLTWGWEIYTSFWVLFNAIERAGTDLTPSTVETGLRTLGIRNDDPFWTSGGFESTEPGRYTFVDTSVAWWWDPHGTPPGGRAGEGCMRVMNGGRRYQPGEWPRGDDALFASGSPCARLDPYGGPAGL